MKRPIAAMLWLSLASLGACGEAGPEPAEPSGSESGWATPPVIETVEQDADHILVSGRAGAGSRVRLTASDGAAHGASADPDGLFQVRLPQAETARLVQPSILRTGEIVPGEGWLFLPPGSDDRAALLRPGSAAVRFNQALMGAVDYDGSGVLVSGRAGAGGEVRVTVDGSPAAVALASADGRYVARLPPTPPGLHVIRATSGPATAAVSIQLSAPETGTFQASATDSGWRVIWPLPGGGSQATWIVGD